MTTYFDRLQTEVMNMKQGLVEKYQLDNFENIPCSLWISFFILLPPTQA